MTTNNPLPLHTPESYRAKALAEVEHSIMAANQLRQALLTGLSEGYLLQQSGILAASATNCRFFIQAASEVSAITNQPKPTESKLPEFLRTLRQ